MDRNHLLLASVKVRTSAVCDAHRQPRDGVRNMHRVPSTQRRRLKKQVGEWRCATWNIGTMTGRSREIAETMKQRKVKILCVQEVKWMGGGVREIGEGYKLYYSGSRTGRNGVGIILNEELKQRVVEVQRPSDRLMIIKVLAGKSLINIVSGYTPQIGCEDQEKEEFREQLEQSFREIPEEEEIFLGADLNCHVRETVGGYEACHGGFGYSPRNEEGEKMLETLESFELVLVNTGFKKRDEHLTTCRSGDNSSQIDFLAVSKRTHKPMRDAKVIPGEVVAHQHRLLAMDGTFSKKRKGETTGKKLQKIKVWKLGICRRIQKGARAKRDIPKVTVVKSEDERILAEKEEVLRRGREYFEHLLNVKNEWEELTELPAVEGPIQQKGDVLECGNHCGIKLLEYLLKVEEKILDQKIRESGSYRKHAAYDRVPRSTGVYGRNEFQSTTIQTHLKLLGTFIVNLYAILGERRSIPMPYRITVLTLVFNT
ncbi:craniofacial development protein 2-like [Penaeus indicus]|uniref:craniofacial development protein 2-like n=1 Tax=Penaeus indicus TaxID=29960 RepID=UPI00300CBFE6